MTEVLCLECAKFSFRRVTDMARYGFGHCQYQPIATVYGARRESDCGHFSPAEPSVIRRREAWIEDKGRAFRDD